MNFKKITETSSNHNHLEQLSTLELLEKINEEDQKVAIAVKKVIGHINNLVDKNYELYGFEFFINNLSTKLEYVNENNTSLKNSYLSYKTSYNFNDKNSLIFETRENKEQSFTEFYNFLFELIFS